MTSTVELDLAQLADVDRRIAELDRRRIHLVAEAKTHGASWEAIAAALGTTRQSAWETYASRVRELLAMTAREPGASEDELLGSAAAALARVRARRRE